MQLFVQNGQIGFLLGAIQISFEFGISFEHCQLDDFQYGHGQWTKDNVPKCLTCKYTNTQIQIHKYSNIASAKVAYMPKVCYIFEKVMVRGPQKNVSSV